MLNFKYKNIIKIFFLFIFFIFVFSGCNTLNSLQLKLGIKNNNFEYIKQGKVEKIVIQNTRDPGFRFIVTDQNSIKRLYDILSSAKEAKQKSFLEPDYIFEMYEGHNKIHKFKYVAGLDKKDGGNLYNNNKVYIVSKRIDNDIIKNFWNIRKPKDFEKVYYNSIVEVIEKYQEKYGKDKIIGLNINDDISIAKFILSYDLEEFKNRLSSKFNGNVELVSKNYNANKYDIIMTVKTEGYKSRLYKGIVTFRNRKDQTETKYYIYNKYDNGRWEIDIYTSKDRPKDF
ncbi:hypothetical protein CLOACE_16440 [Clostridium acetireducens DSM 10703]|uniref:YhfM-like domain-containing protein n=1 Tax=Clostridium acetireducens DSM 10703 TaxID=1121290 RepID=A0A1E8EY87_9CLOT|nr:hypothetical protein [Clostridium acetireducens]OFI05486.1 hypothetical protein CLOACE_16440 [Clostridium acetireducens DSM 10703]